MKSKACFLARCAEGGRIERLSDWLGSDLDVIKMVETLWQ